MEPMRLSEIVTATGGRLVNGQEQEVTGISIDTRTLQPGDLYVAIRGRRLDGHQFCQQAVERGAVGVVVETEAAVPDQVLAVVVANTTAALARIASLHRDRLSARVIAVTGSNGKTTTKELLAAILGRRFRTLKPEASFNNDIGVPLTVLRMSRETEVAIFEIEMNELGGTARLAAICRPEIGVITNIGDTHLEFMKNRQGVAQEKAELLAALPENGVAVVNADDPAVMAISRARPELAQISFGLENRATVFATDVRDDGIVGSRFRLQGEHEVVLPIPGRHNILNCLAACAAATAVGMEFDEMPAAIASFVPPPMRLRVLKLGPVTLIEDCYNANPQSMAAALEVLGRAGPIERRIAFLGDMLELGEDSALFHERLGSLVAGFVNRLVLVGPDGEFTARGARAAGLETIVRFNSSAEARGAVFDLVKPGDTILVKGSRAMAMELVSQEIIRHYEDNQG